MPNVLPREDLELTRPLTPAAQLRGLRRWKSGLGNKTWLVIDSTGQAELIDTGRQKIMRVTGLSAQDLRILDPSLSYPSTLMGREKALVIKLEHIKGVITAKDVWLLNSKDPAVAPFVEELKRRCSHHYQANALKVNRNNGDDDQSEGASRQTSEAVQEEVQPSRGVNQQHDRLGTLPFEFVALEACLEAACSCLDYEAKALEQEAYPASDKLISKISTRYLERVRQIKSRLVGLTGRVQKIRDEIEHLLEDDEDMAEMYLTSKLLQEENDQSPSSSSSSSSSVAAKENELHELDNEERNCEGDDRIMLDESSISPQKSLNDGEMEGGSKEIVSRGGLSTSKQLDVAELEMLLEAYFVQLDGTLNKLSALREYIQDTEDYVNILLDDNQNNLLQMGVMISTATLFISMFVEVTATFGMDFRIEHLRPPKPTLHDFYWTVGGCTAGTIILYAITIAWYKHKRLI